MDKIVVHGTIGSPDTDVVARLLASWMKVKADSLDVRIRLVGSEINYKNSAAELYCYSSTDYPEFLLEASLATTLDDGGASVKRLFELCQKQGLSSRFNYVQEDEDGQEISEEFSVE